MDTLRGVKAAAEAGRRLLPFTARNFRENLQRLTGMSEEATRGLQAHHVFPQKLEEKFQPLGINIHDPRFGAWVPERIHQSWSGRYQKEWIKFFEDFKELGRAPTPEEVFAKAEELAQKYGFEWRRP